MTDEDIDFDAHDEDASLRNECDLKRHGWIDALCDCQAELFDPRDALRLEVATPDPDEAARLEHLLLGSLQSLGESGQTIVRSARLLATLVREHWQKSARRQVEEAKRGKVLDDLIAFLESPEAKEAAYYWAARAEAEAERKRQNGEAPYV